MLRSFYVAVVGAAVGGAIALGVWLSGLQSSYPRLLIVLLSGTGATAALTGYEVGKRSHRLYTLKEIEKASNRLAESYTGTFLAEDIKLAIYQLPEQLGRR